MVVLWTVVSVLVSVLIGIGLTLAVADSSYLEFWVARGCFAASALMLAACTVYWEFKTNALYLCKITVGFSIGLSVFVLFPTSIQWINMRAARAAKPPDALLTSKIQEINRLRELIGGKDETGLRQLFDLPEIVKFNIRLVKRSIAPNSISPAQSAEINDFFKNGHAVVNPKFCNVDTTGGGFHVEYLPGKIGIVNVSRKYIASRESLAKFESSVQLPTDIVVAIKGLDQTVAANIDLLLVVLNERLAADPKNIILEENPASRQYYGASSGAYWDRFAQLKPEQEKVLAQIRKYLQVE